jgi:hypothetical protein
MRLDSSGIPRAWYRVTGIAYWPGYIAWYALVNLGQYLRHRDSENLEIFLNQIAWLERHAVVREDGAVVWPMNFDYQVGSIVLKAPWISAHTQGLVISALVRGWRLTGRPHLLELLEKSAKVFDLDVDEQGIRTPVGDYVLYTEAPGYPPPGIMDGFMTSLLGLYDLATETTDPDIQRMFSQGIRGLAYMLPQWSYRKKWSWYGNRAYLSPPEYHCLNRLLLTVLARLSNETSLVEYATHWDSSHLSPADRAEIFLAFQFTKNVSRLKHRTWLQSPTQNDDCRGTHPSCLVRD